MMMEVKYWNPTTRVFILRVGRDDESKAVTSLILMTSIYQYLCKVRILHVGGKSFMCNLLRYIREGGESPKDYD